MYRIKLSHVALALAGIVAGAHGVEVQAGKVSPVQSAARPLGLKTVGPVMIGGSDERSAQFMKETFPAMAELAKKTLPERQEIKDPVKVGLDPSRLKLEYDYNVRAYFIGEGAGNRNSLGFYTTDFNPQEGIQATDAQLIFPDASSSASYLGSNTGVRSAKEPLMPGDFVQLGTLKQGTQINPFLIADGANGGKDVYTPYAWLNPDGLDHFVMLSVTAIADSPYVLLAVEDLRGGGDRDYNDLVIALDVGYRNVMALTGAAVPAPPAVWALGAVAAWYFYRRRHTSIVATADA